MKNKNKKLSILVALLLLGVGVSFAYFVGKTIFKGTGATLTGTTATLEGAKLDIKGELSFNDENIYPGHQTVSSITATAKGEDVIIPFNIIWEGNNGLNTDLKYKVYRRTEPLEEGKEIKATCEKKIKVVEGKQQLSEECEISNINELGEAIYSGTIPMQKQENITIAADQFITATTPDPTIYYYYVVIEYPNENRNQNEDLEGTFNGTIKVELNDASADINILSIKVEEEKGKFTEKDDIPANDGTYILDTNQSTCTNDATLGWDNKTNNLIVNNLHKTGTDCDLYFKQKPTSKDTLADLGLTANNESDGCPVVDENGSASVTGTEVTEKLICSSTDDYGTSYYFRGKADNWVKFAGHYWRIIRINGNGTIRLIYSGDSNAKETGEGTAINNGAGVAFNTNYNDNKYVGFMYVGAAGSASGSYDEAHKVNSTSTKSTILQTIETWYKDTSGIAEQYRDKLDGETGFCGDREVVSGHGSYTGDGYAKQISAYGPAHRVWTSNEARDDSTQEPTFICKQKSQDLYTTTGSEEGNKALTYPVGLITSDEVIFAGGLAGQINNGYWLYTNKFYWTMSPFRWDSSAAYVFRVAGDGRLDWYYVSYTSSIGVRPVINLKAGTKFKVANPELPHGTSTNPYEVV